MLRLSPNEQLGSGSLWLWSATGGTWVRSNNRCFHIADSTPDFNVTRCDSWFAGTLVFGRLRPERAVLAVVHSLTPPCNRRWTAGRFCLDDHDVYFESKSSLSCSKRGSGLGSRPCAGTYLLVLYAAMSCGGVLWGVIAQHLGLPPVTLLCAAVARFGAFPTFRITHFDGT